jgi:hypothetical protein
MARTFAGLDPAARTAPSPVEPESGEVLEDRRGAVGPAACGVDILEPQQEPPARLARAAKRTAHR